MSGETFTASVKWAAPPFDKKTADFILKSSDDVHFRVRKGILAEASPVFDDMFANAQPSTSAALNCGDELIDGVPAISVEESSTVLDYVLRLYYPPYQSPPLLPTEESLFAVMDAANKYLMEHARQNLMQQFRKIAEEGHGIRMYAIACRRRWADEMRIAARASLKQSLKHETMEELKHITGLDYSHLLRYRQRCVEAVRVVADDAKYTWKPPNWRGDVVPGDSIPSYLRQVGKLPDAWSKGYMASIRGKLAECPHSEVVYDSSLSLTPFRIAFEAGLNDEARLKQAVEAFRKDFAAAIDAAILTVALEIA